MSIYHTSFLSFKQFARCLCSTPTLGPEYSTHWGSWSLVSRGLVKALCGRWKTRPSREPWRTRFLESGQLSRARVMDVIFLSLLKAKHSPKKFKRFPKQRWGKSRASLCKGIEPWEPPETVHPLLGHSRKLLRHWGKTAQVRTKKSWGFFSLLLEDLFQSCLACMDLVSWTDSGFSGGRWLLTSQDQCFPTILNQTTLKFILKSGRNLVSLVRTAEHPPALRREGGGMSQEMFPCLLLSVAFMEISSWFTKRKENMTWVLCGYRKFPQLQTPEQEWGTLERCPCRARVNALLAFTTDDGFFLCSHWKTL